MSNGWGVVCAVLWSSASVACFKPPAPTPLPSPHTAQAPVGAAPQRPVHLDDPKACIDVPSSADGARVEAAQADEVAVERELLRRAELEWPAIRACLGGSPSVDAVHLEIEVGPDGTSRARVTEAPSSTCDAVACIRDRLSGLQVAVHEADRALTFSQKLDLDPHATQRFQSEPRLSHREKPAQALACLDESVGPRLPPEVIRQTVRANYGEFRKCYEDGLGRNPDLQGRVDVRFVIGKEGTVSDVAVADNQLADCAVVRCIRDGFLKMAFPSPKAGIVTVSYPIMLMPDNSPAVAPATKPAP